MIYRQAVWTTQPQICPAITAVHAHLKDNSWTRVPVSLPYINNHRRQCCLTPIPYGACTPQLGPVSDPFLCLNSSGFTEVGLCVQARLALVAMYAAPQHTSTKSVSYSQEGIGNSKAWLSEALWYTSRKERFFQVYELLQG